MSNGIKKLLSMLLCGAMLLGTVGCGSDATLGKDDRYLELVNSPSTTLDNVWYNPGGIFRCAIFESLLNTSADMMELEGALAKKYTVSEDGLEYVFTLRNDVKWHDGEAFDAEDVLFSLKAALRSTEINGIFTSAFQYIEGAEAYSIGASEELSGVTVQGKDVTIRLSTPIGSFLAAVAQFAILPEHILGDVLPGQIPMDTYWEKPVGCGSYAIADAVQGEYFLLEANTDYYGKSPGIKKIRIRMNEEDCLTAIQEGRLDFYVTNDPEEIAEMKGIVNCSEHSLNILFPCYLILNLSEDEGVNESLKDVRVRKALLLAIDRETVVDAVFPGSSVTDTLIPAWDSWYPEDAEEYLYNPEEAKRLLEEAGFDFSQPLRLRYSVKGQATADLMSAIAVYWEAVGIEVDLQKFDGSGSEHMFNIRDFDVCYKRLSAFNHASIYGEIHGDGVMQNALYHQPVYDGFIDKLEMTVNEEERKGLVYEMQKLDQEYLLRIPLFSLANMAYVYDEHLELPEIYGNLWYRYDLCFEDWKMVNG